MEFDEPFPVLQHEPDSCLPTTIKTLLDHLGKKHANSAIKLSLKKLSKLCGYKFGFGVDVGNIDEVILNINNELKKRGYIINESVGNPKIDTIIKILGNKQFSAPLVFVSSEYYKESKKGYSVSEIPDDWHSLVVRSISNDSDEIVVFDPLSKPQPTDSENSVKIKILNFMKYWNGTRNHILWIQKSNIDLTSTQKDLSLYLSK